MSESKVQNLKDAPVNSEVLDAPERETQTRREPCSGLQTSNNEPRTTELDLRSEPHVAAFPVSFAQESLWFVEQMAPGNAAYNMPEAWRLQGRLDARVLERSVRQIIQRHETLRTVFGSNDGKPAQIILPECPFRLDVRDVSQSAHREAEL